MTTKPYRWEMFSLQYDPEPSGRYQDIRQGYWIAKSLAGFDGDGLTPEAAMASLINSMTQHLLELKGSSNELG